MFRTLKRTLSGNLYLILGLLIGVYMSTILRNQPKCRQPQRYDHQQQQQSFSIFEAPAKNVSQKTTSTNNKQKPIRPRYYSTELGIREKLFMGVLTSEENIEGQAMHINATGGHLVDNIKFFVATRRKFKMRFNLTGIVGFTDTRRKYRIFQVVKYVADSFLLDYDYYFLVSDYSYVNVRKLKDVVGKISVSMDVYMGTPMVDSTFCSLDAGILISNSVLKTLKENLEWCINHAVSDDNSENFGRCVYHSIGLDCQRSVQGQVLGSYKVKHSNFEKYLPELSEKPEFSNAVSVYPVLQGKEFYLLNVYYAHMRLKRLKSENDALSSDLTETWPPGHRSGNKPPTRFDVPRQQYFNMTHVLFPDDFHEIREHTTSEREDVKSIVESIKAKISYEKSEKLSFRRFVNGYKTFDLSRGMDYVVDLGFRDLTTGKEVIKRFEVCKPLGKVEFIPAPYVTENTRITILLPVEEHELEQSLEFLRRYSRSVMDRNDRSFLMLVLLYQYKSPSKGRDDVFYSLKSAALKLRSKYQNEDAKIAWVSVRLPEIGKKMRIDEYKVLNYAVIDLGLRKVGLESLILVLDAWTDVAVDFLNRVRMNTIEGYQVFSPIPFRQYDPNISGIDRLDVHKSAGHFDREQYRYLSFYARDYVNVRKKSQFIAPIVKSDNDIVRLLEKNVTSNGNIFEMFVKFSDQVHCMRAPEMSLKMHYHVETDASRYNKFLGNKAQLAALILTKKDQISDM